MAKERDKQKKFITTELNRKLYDYNNESTPQSDLDFITGKSDYDARAYRQQNMPQDNSQGYMGGVNPLGNTYDYTATRYDNDIYSHQLGDLEDIRSQNQGVFSALANSTANFLGKTAVNIVGGLTGAVYGAGSALYNGDISKLWDNEVTQALDETSDAIGEAFRVYKSSDYQDKFILNKMISNPVMFADEFMDTLSFTAGAVVTELLSGGLASGAVAPKAMQYLNKLFKSSKAISGLDKAGDVAKALEGLSTANKLTTGLEKAGKLTRQLATGAFWEASVEARHLAEEMRNKMTQDYIEQMEASGVSVDPNNLPEDIQADIDERIKNASLATLGLNMALVGYSNISQFPTVFKSFGNSKRLNNLIRQADGTYTSAVANMTRNGRIASKTLAALKNPFMEGFVEEGGQGVISGTMGSFFDRKNDLEANNATENLVKSFSDAFYETYATTEGLNEVLMGALIGGVGAPGKGLLSVLGKNTTLGKYGYEKQVDSQGNVTYTKAPIWDGGVVGGIREFNAEQEEAERVATMLNDSPDLVKALQNNYETQVRAYELNKRLDNAIDNDDHFEFANVKDDIFFNYVNNRLENGLIGDVEARLQDLEDMSAEEFTIAFKGEEAANKDTQENMEFFKKTQLETARENLEQIVKARNIAEGLTAGLDLSSEYLEAAKMDITYYMSKAGMMDNREKSINKTLANLSGNKIISSNTRGNTLGEAIKSLQERISETPTKELKKRLTVMKRMEKQFGSDISSPFVSSIINFAELDPVAYNANKRDINLMVKDLSKLTDAKNTLISLFQGLDNYRSILKYTDYLKQREDARVEDMENSVEEAEQAIQEKQTQEAVNTIKDKVKQATKKQPEVVKTTPEAVPVEDAVDEVEEEDNDLNLDEDTSEPLIADEEVEDAIETVNINSRIKDIKQVFDFNPELSNIGTEEQYYNYLKYKFPKTKTFDIVSHVSRVSGIEEFKINNSNRGSFINSKVNGTGVYFASADSHDYWSMELGLIDDETGEYSKNRNVYFALLDSRQPQKFKKNYIEDSEVNDTTDVVVNYSRTNPNLVDEYIVKDTSIINILGSKQDIEDFKEFVNSSPSETTSTTEESVITTISRVNDFSYYESSDPDLLNKIIPLAFLRNIPSQVEFRKRVYLGYRSSQPNLPDVGTPKDIQNYNDYFADNSAKYDEDYMPVEEAKVDEIEEVISEINIETPVEENVSENTDTSEITSPELLDEKLDSNEKSLAEKLLTNSIQKKLADRDRINQEIDSYRETMKGMKSSDQDLNGAFSTLSVISNSIQKEFNSALKELALINPNEFKELFRKIDLFFDTKGNYKSGNLNVFTDDYLNNLLNTAFLDLITEAYAGITNGEFKNPLIGSSYIIYPDGKKESITGLKKRNWNLDDIYNNLINSQIDEIATEPEIKIEPEVSPEILAEQNTEQIVEDEQVIDEQIGNPEALRDSPVDSLALTALDDGSNLNEYLGMSLRNIHNKREGGRNLRREDGKLDLYEDYPKDALDPKVALPGSQIDVTVASESEYREYTGGKNDYDTVSSNLETLPLIAKQNGKFIGFLLTVRGAQTSSNNLLDKETLENLKALRSQMMANRGTNFQLKVMDKSNGVSLIMKDSQGNSIFKPIKETLSVNGRQLAEGVKIAADINGVLHSHEGQTLDLDIINPSIQSGKVFAILPLPSGRYVKQPLRVSTVSQNDADTVYAMVKMFAANEKYTPDAKTINARNDFRNQTGINLGNINEFYQNLKNIIFIKDKGPSQFFTKTRQDDGSYVYELKSPKGDTLVIPQSEMGKGTTKTNITNFIIQNFYRGFNVNMMNTGSYRHISLRNKQLVADRYDTYMDYAIQNDVLLSDVYGERMDDSSNKMFFTMAPFIKIDYRSTGKIEGIATANPTVVSPVQKVSDNQINENGVPDAPIPTFLDGLDMDNFDINFSLLDLKNDIDDIMSPDIEQEVDNLMRFCK